MDRARDAGPQRLLEDDPRAADVDREGAVGAGAQRRDAGDVEHALDAAHGAAHRTPVEHVAVGELDVEAVELVERRALAHETRTASPRATSRRVTCDPTRPVAPVTRVVIPGDYLGCPACRTSQSSPTPPTTCRARPSPSSVSARSACTSTTATRQEREADIVDLTAFYDALRTADTLPTTSQPSIGDFLAVYEPLVRAGPRHRLDPHLGRDLGHGRGGTAGRGRARARPARGSRSSTRSSRCGALGMVVLAAVRGRARGRRRRAPSRRARARRSRATRAVVRRRHPRVPAARRAHRRRPGMARRRAEDQADPHLRRRDRARSSACAPSGRAFERMVDYLRSRHDDGADGWVVQHIQAPDVCRAPGRQRARDLRQRAALRVGDRPGHRRPRGPGPRRRRRDAAGAAAVAPRTSAALRGQGTEGGHGRRARSNVGHPASGRGKTDVRTLRALRRQESRTVPDHRRVPRVIRDGSREATARAPRGRLQLSLDAWPRGAAGRTRRQRDALARPRARPADRLGRGADGRPRAGLVVLAAHSAAR